MKIKRIQINNYRAFLVNGNDENERYIIDLPNGENLLLYGENGSGKSSLFKALRDFFVSASNAGVAFQKNLFYEEAQNAEQPFIDIVIDDDSHHRFSADGNKYALLENKLGGNTSYISQANITSGFISYRDLLKLHLRQDNQEPDLVSLFFGEEGLFSDMIVPAPASNENKLSFKDLWKKCLDFADQDAINDYNSNISALLDELEKRANMLLAFFKQECKLNINYTEATGKKGELTVIYPPTISFKVTLFDEEIPRHDDILNEARLTALAISVFLAHQLCLPPTDLRILFLDDIFIGLDMSNRIPLIKILTASDLGDGTSFQDFQIFLTTYDREWFHIAKTYLEAGWQKEEFYVDNHSSIVERPLIRKSDTYKERAEFHFIHGDYPACANYLRKALEQMLRNIIPENKLYKGLGNSDIEACQISISKQQLSMKETDHSWLFFLKEAAGISASLPRAATLHNLIDIFNGLMNDYGITFPYCEELTKIKNRLLNPLSHDDLRSSIFKKELEIGFNILKELNKIKSKILVAVSKDKPSYLFFDIDDKDNSKIWIYKFELLGNLRYLEYGGIGLLLNTECKIINRTLKSDNSVEVLNEGKSRNSINEMCKAITLSFVEKEKRKGFELDKSISLNFVYTENGQQLNSLI